jgi:hypothetical protein
MLDRWTAPQRTLQVLDRAFPGTPQGRQEQHEYLKTKAKDLTVGPIYRDVAEVRVRITWVQGNGTAHTEERDLHLVRVGNGWRA